MAVGVAVSAVAAALVPACGSSERATYVKESEKLFEQLPRFPGAQLTGQHSSAYAGEGDSSPGVGYTNV